MWGSHFKRAELKKQHLPDHQLTLDGQSQAIDYKPPVSDGANNSEVHFISFRCVYTKLPFLFG